MKKRLIMCVLVIAMVLSFGLFATACNEGESAGKSGTYSVPNKVILETEEDKDLVTFTGDYKASDFTVESLDTDYVTASGNTISGKAHGIAVVTVKLDNVYVGYAMVFVNYSETELVAYDDLIADYCAEVAKLQAGISDAFDKTVEGTADITVKDNNGNDTTLKALKEGFIGDAEGDMIGSVAKYTAKLNNLFGGYPEDGNYAGWAIDKDAADDIVEDAKKEIGEKAEDYEDILTPNGIFDLYIQYVNDFYKATSPDALIYSTTTEDRTNALTAMYAGMDDSTKTLFDELDYKDLLPSATIFAADKVLSFSKDLNTDSSDGVDVFNNITDKSVLNKDDLKAIVGSITGYVDFTGATTDEGDYGTLTSYATDTTVANGDMIDKAVDGFLTTADITLDGDVREWLDSITAADEFKARVLAAVSTTDDDFETYIDKSYDMIIVDTTTAAFAASDSEIIATYAYYMINCGAIEYTAGNTAVSTWVPTDNLKAIISGYAEETTLTAKYVDKAEAAFTKVNNMGIENANAVAAANNTTAVAALSAYRAVTDIMTESFINVSSAYVLGADLHNKYEVAPGMADGWVAKFLGTASEGVYTLSSEKATVTADYDALSNSDSVYDEDLTATEGYIYNVYDGEDATDKSIDTSYALNYIATGVKTAYTFYTANTDFVTIASINDGTALTTLNTFNSDIDASDINDTAAETAVRARVYTPAETAYNTVFALVGYADATVDAAYIAANYGAIETAVENFNAKYADSVENKPEEDAIVCYFMDAGSVINTIDNKYADVAVKAEELEIALINGYATDAQGETINDYNAYIKALGDTATIWEFVGNSALISTEYTDFEGTMYKRVYDMYMKYAIATAATADILNVATDLTLDTDLTTLKTDLDDTTVSAAAQTSYAAFELNFIDAIDYADTFIKDLVNYAGQDDITTDVENLTLGTRTNDYIEVYYTKVSSDYIKLLDKLDGSNENTINVAVEYADYIVDPSAATIVFKTEYNWMETYVGKGLTNAISFVNLVITPNGIAKQYLTDALNLVVNEAANDYINDSVMTRYNEYPNA